MQGLRCYFSLASSWQSAHIPNDNSVGSPVICVIHGCRPRRQLLSTLTYHTLNQPDSLSHPLQDPLACNAYFCRVSMCITNSDVKLTTAIRQNQRVSTSDRTTQLQTLIHQQNLHQCKAVYAIAPSSHLAVAWFARSAGDRCPWSPTANMTYEFFCMA